MRRCDTCRSCSLKLEELERVLHLVGVVGVGVLVLELERVLGAVLVLELERVLGAVLVLELERVLVLELERVLLPLVGADVLALIDIVPVNCYTQAYCPYQTSIYHFL